MKKNLVLYHANCADGFGAAYSAWLKLGDDDTEYRPMKYFKNDATIEDFERAVGAVYSRVVYILDFSLPMQFMKYVIQNSERMVWLDHHKTAFDMWLEGNPEHIERYEPTLRHPKDLDNYVLLDNAQSGAMLAWRYFHPYPHDKIPAFIMHIDDRDRWVFANPNSRAFHAALMSLNPWSFKQWHEELGMEYMGPDTKPLYDDRYWRLIENGAAIVRMQTVTVQSIVEEAAMTCGIPFFTPNIGEITGGDPTVEVDVGLAANCPAHLVSDVGHALALKSGTYGLAWWMESSGKINVALRSIANYDVARIAKVHGGGGHLNASGFGCMLEELNRWLVVR
jgi:uncharacterized protein